MSPASISSLKAPPPQPIRVAAAQCRPIPEDVPANLSLMDRLLADAAGQDVDLVVFPEMMLTGYGIGAEAVSRLAEPVDGPSGQSVAEMAHQHGVAVCFGHPERDGQAVFNSVSLVSESGERLTGGRKMHLFGDVDAQQFSAADRAPQVATWHGWTVGTAICFDVEFPETTRLLAEQGADLVLVPTANMVGFEVVNRVLVPARAAENQLALVYANHTGSDPLFEYNGDSLIAGPDGSILAEASATGSPTGEQLVIADLDPHRVLDARRDFSYLTQRRTDLY